MASKDTAATSNTHNVLASGTVINGNICAEEDFRVDGVIEGEITCKGKIIIGRNSVITGNINSLNVELMGEVTGNILCTNTVILRASSKLYGDIKTQVIEIEPGAVFFGACSMITEE